MRQNIKKQEEVRRVKQIAELEDLKHKLNKRKQLEDKNKEIRIKNKEK